MKQHQRIPPQVPDSVAELDKAIMLLGERVKTDLRTKGRDALTELLGRYPDAKTAAVWKTALKQLRQDEIFQG